MTYMVLAEGPRGAVVNGPFTLEKALRAARNLTSIGCTQAFLTQCNTGFRLDFADFATGASTGRRELSGICSPVPVAGGAAMGSVP